MPPFVSLAKSAEGLAQLRQRISALERTAQKFAATVAIAHFIDSELPHRGLPLGCVHEVHGTRLAQAIAFASLLTSRIAPNGNVFFIAPNRLLHPVGLLPFNIDFKNWIHITPRRPADRIWAALEALRCREVTAVIGVLPLTDLTICRQFQLAAESSRATCFLLGEATTPSAASVITRWRVASRPCSLPSAGFNQCFWKIDLTYCRGGRPNSWQAIYQNGLFENIELQAPFRKGPVMQTYPVLEERLAI